MLINALWISFSQKLLNKCEMWKLYLVKRRSHLKHKLTQTHVNQNNCRIIKCAFNWPKQRTKAWTLSPKLIWLPKTVSISGTFIGQWSWSKIISEQCSSQPKERLIVSIAPFKFTEECLGEEKSRTSNCKIANYPKKWCSALNFIDQKEFVMAKAIFILNNSSFL